MSANAPFVPLFPPFLNAGSTGSAVHELHKILCLLGLDTDHELEFDGEYGGVTVKLVKKMQVELNRLMSSGLTCDGNFGRDTRKAMIPLGIHINDIPFAAEDGLPPYMGLTQWAGPEHDGLKTWPEPQADEADAQAEIPVRATTHGGGHDIQLRDGQDQIPPGAFDDTDEADKGEPDAADSGASPDGDALDEAEGETEDGTPEANTQVEPQPTGE